MGKCPSAGACGELWTPCSCWDTLHVCHQVCPRCSGSQATSESQQRSRVTFSQAGDIPGGRLRRRCSALALFYHPGPDSKILHVQKLAISLILWFFYLFIFFNSTNWKTDLQWKFDRYLQSGHKQIKSVDSLHNAANFGQIYRFYWDISAATNSECSLPDDLSLWFICSSCPVVQWADFVKKKKQKKTVWSSKTQENPVNKICRVILPVSFVSCWTPAKKVAPRTLFSHQKHVRHSLFCFLHRYHM